MGAASALRSGAHSPTADFNVVLRTQPGCGEHGALLMVLPCEAQLGNLCTPAVGESTKRHGSVATMQRATRSSEEARASSIAPRRDRLPKFTADFAGGHQGSYLEKLSAH